MPPGEDAGISPAGARPSPKPHPILLLGLRNIAIFDLIRSRRKSLNNSGPVPHFSKIMTSKIRGVGEMRYNRARSMKIKSVRSDEGVNHFNSSVTMNDATSDRAPPRRISDKKIKNSSPAVPRRGPEAGPSNIV